MRHLGIDYGSKRVGLAISDEGGVLAFPYKIIPNNTELVDMIHNICGEEEVSAIVLGESTDLSGNQNKIMGSIEEFKRNLEAESALYEVEKKYKSKTKRSRFVSSSTNTRSLFR